MTSNGTAKGTFNIALMTSGGLAPCLSSSVASLIKYWKIALSEGKISGLTIRCYKDGYKGMLIDESFLLPEDMSIEEVDRLHETGGSPIGNSRVKVSFLYRVGVIFRRIQWITTHQDLISNLHFLYINL